MKVWFQNRRTKQKKDQGKDSELRSVVSETAATCSVLRLLEQGRLLTPPGLPGLLPHCGSSSLGSALRGPSLGITANGGSSSSSSSSAASSGTAGGSPPLPAVTSSGTVTGLQGSPPAHGLFSFPMPSLLGSVASRISSTPLGMAGSLAGNLQELSARYLSSSAFEPYSRTNGKEVLDKKVLEWSLGVSFCLCCCCGFEIRIWNELWLSLFFFNHFRPLLSHQCCCILSLAGFFSFFMSSTCTLDASHNCKKVDLYFSKTRIFRAFCTKSKFLQIWHKRELEEGM